MTKTKGTIKEKGHGVFWWLFIGWWWKNIELFTWFIAFFPRLIFSLVLQKKKYKTETVSVAQNIKQNS